MVLKGLSMRSIEAFPIIIFQEQLQLKLQSPNGHYMEETPLEIFHI